MADGKIYITISDKREGGTGIGKLDDGVGTDRPVERKGNLALEYAKHQFFNLISSEAKTMVNYSIQNIGNFTGDYDAQREVSVAMQVLNTGIGLGESFIAGMTATGGNPIGGLIALGVSAVAKGINYGLQERTNRFNNYKQNYNIQKLRDLSGLDGTTNGGRI